MDVTWKIILREWTMKVQSEGISVLIKLKRDSKKNENAERMS